jgi:uncharacterized damage-inducible protein DinB
MGTRSAQLAEVLVRNVTGPMWHGPALAELLAGVPYQQAASRPIPDGHTIWELVAHVTAWAGIARARVHGQRIGDPSPEENWPAPPEATEAEWTAAVAALQESHRALAVDVAALDDLSLDRQISGLDYSLATLLHGVVEHGTYHGGQVALLKKYPVS